MELSLLKLSQLPRHTYNKVMEELREAGFYRAEQVSKIEERGRCITTLQVRAL
jgi:hypothetical protein